MKKLLLYLLLTLGSLSTTFAQDQPDNADPSKKEQKVPTKKPGKKPGC